MLNIHLNKSIESYSCIKCGMTYPVAEYHKGCSKCHDQGAPASLVPDYQPTVKLSERRPYPDIELLGEGNTPIITPSAIKEHFGISKLSIKCEFLNPTGSHKDRMSRNVTLRAKELGLRGVVAASSGNAGLSIARYAAVVGIECVIATREDIHPQYKKLIEASGAQLVLTETALERWDVVGEYANSGKWLPATNFSLPPVGSHILGVEGYKQVAYEIFEQLNIHDMPSHILVPVSRGDLLWGIYKGISDLMEAGLLSTMPVLIAVEPINRIQRVLDGENYTNLFSGDFSHAPSIGGNTVTYQALSAVANSKGTAITASSESVKTMQNYLSRNGLSLESAASAPFAVLSDLVSNNTIHKDNHVLIIATSDFYDC